eukprot:m.147066 g.147066  ORF g.147066 m.147066 type:complete len:497 (+) comp11657_c0_seq1:90-1580(+)
MPDARPQCDDAVHDDPPHPAHASVSPPPPSSGAPASGAAPPTARAVVAGLGGRLDAGRIMSLHRCSLNRTTLAESRLLTDHVFQRGSTISNLTLDYNSLGDGILDDLAAAATAATLPTPSVPTLDDQTAAPSASQQPPTDAWVPPLRFLSLTSVECTLGRPVLATFLSAVRLTHLSLASNPQGEVGALVDGLAAVSDTLVSLDLAYCNLVPGAVVRLVKVFEIGSGGILESLRLDYNNVGDGAAVVLAAAVATTDSLTILSLIQTGIGARGGEALADAYTRSATLQELRLNGNEMSHRACDMMINALAYNEHRCTCMDVEDEVLYQRLCWVLSMDDTLRQFAALCVDAWCSHTDTELDTFWTHLGFDADAATELVRLLDAFSKDDVVHLVSTFSGHVLDAILRSGADGLVSKALLQTIADRSVVAQEIVDHDLNPPASLKHLCRRAVRCCLGANVVPVTLCSKQASIPLSIRRFLFYGHDIIVEGTAVARHHQAMV